MNYLNTWAETFYLSLQTFWLKTIGFIPEVLGALIILIIGLMIASTLSILSKKLVNLTKLDSLAEKVKLHDELKKFGLEFTFATIIAWIVKWFIIIVVIITAIDVLKITQLTNFLNEIVLYIPNVIVAVIILGFGGIASRFIFEVVHKAVKASKMLPTSGQILAALAKWSIIIFSIMAALVQLEIATSLIQILFTGFIAMLALAGGLAFGLGGKEKAAKLLEKLDQEIKQKN